MKGEHSTFSYRLLWLLLAVGLFWGMNWQVMKVGLQEIAPLWFRGTTALVGGLGLLTLARLVRQPILPPRGKWRVLLWLGLTNIAGWSALSIYGLSMLPSGRAALLAYTMPTWSVLISMLWLGERPTLRRLSGIALGSVGVLAMIGAELAEIAGHPWGAILMVSAALVWALGLVSVKRFPVAMPTLAFSGWTLVLGALPLVALALLFEPRPDWQELSFWPWFALIYNIFVSLMFCNWAWYSIVLRLPVAVSSLSSLIVPLFGVSGGMLLLGERPGLADWLGMVCILGAVATVVLPGKKRG